jgi:type IV pilus assembly protein PilM
MAQGIVGLDIGSSAVRAVELTVDERGIASVSAFGQVGLHEGLVVGGEVRESAEVGSSIRRLWQQGEFSEKRVHIGVAGLRVITRELDLPLVAPTELDSAVRYQAADVIPFPVEQSMTSAKVLQEFKSPDGAPMLRVLVAAAHRSVIDSVVEAVQAGGLDPISIDLDSAAIARSFRDDALQGLEAVVSIGSALTLVVIHKRGQVQFVRTIDLGGQTITEAIAGTFDIPLQDAEMLKFRLVDPTFNDPSSRRAGEAAVRAIVAEIQSSLQFFSSLPEREPIQRIVLTGGGSRAAGLLDQLSESLAWPVLPIVSPPNVDLRRLGLTAEQSAVIGTTLPVPLGLALPDPYSKPFNLLPPEIEEKIAARKVKRFVFAIAAIVLVVVLGLSAWRFLNIRSARNQVNALSSQVATIQNVDIPKYNQAVALKNSVAAQQARILPAVTGEIDWLVVLNQLSQYLTPAATFSGLDMAPIPTTASTTAPSSTAKTSPATTEVGTVTGGVTVGSLAEVTTWGQLLSSAPVFFNVTTGGLSAGADGVSFSASMSINALATSTRAAQFSQVLP